MRVIVRYFFLFTLTLTFTQAFAINLEQGQTIYQTSCAKCHGVDGNTTTVNFPKLAGQHTTYLTKQVTDYQTGKRIDPIMAPIAQKLTPAQTENVLVYIKSFQAHYGAVDPTLREQGEKLYRTGDRIRSIPACASCHGPTGEGIYEAAYPKLGGQNPDYIVHQLELFQAQKRTNDLRQPMQSIAAKLTAQDKAAVASFISGLH